MTQNQLKFAQLVEDRRHNRESERLSEYANYSGRLSAYASQSAANARMASAQAASAQAIEARRHNIEQERLTSRGQNFNLIGKAADVGTKLAETIYKYGG